MDLPKEITNLIFFELPSTDLPTLPQVCHAWFDLLADPVFWITKIKQEFGPEFLKEKPAEESFKDQFRHLLSLKEKSTLPGKSDRTDTLLFLEKFHSLPKEAANIVIKEGFVKMLDWSNKKNLKSTFFGFAAAAEKGYLDVFKWAEANDCLPGDAIVSYAARAGQLGLMIWFEERKIRCLQGSIWATVKSDSLPVLTWLKVRGYHFDDRATAAAIKEKKMNSLNWLYRNNLLHEQVAIPLILERKDLELMMWLLEFEIGTPDFKWANLAAEKKDLVILDHLADRGVFPIAKMVVINDFEVFKWMLEHGVPMDGVKLYPMLLNIEIDGLNWMKEHQIIDLDSTMMVALYRKKKELIHWVLKENYHPLPKILESEIRNGNLYSLTIFAEYGFLPTQKAADLAVGHNNLAALEWMEIKGVLPTKVGAYWAWKNKKTKIIEWLNQRGITWDRRHKKELEEKIKEFLLR